MEDRFCERCGKKLSRETVGVLCSKCWIDVRKERHEQKKQKQIEAREKKLQKMTGPPRPGFVGIVPGKHRCAKCGHAFPIDCSAEVACGYLDDADKYNLPPRPRPSANPNHCLYWSKTPTKAGWLTEEQKTMLRQYPNQKKVLDMENCEVYASAAEASTAVDVPLTKIIKECTKTSAINANRRFRYLAPEELLLLRPSGG